MLEIAMDNKAVQNLEKEKASVKVTIIKSSFSHFHDPNFVNIANQIGVEIENVHPSVDQCASVANNNVVCNNVIDDIPSASLFPGDGVLSNITIPDTVCHPSHDNVVRKTVSDTYPSSISIVFSPVDMSPVYKSTYSPFAAVNTEHPSCVD